MDIEHPVKVLIVGNGAVGKSSMIQRYCKGEFTEEYKKTIGVDFLEKTIEVESEKLRLMIWDTAGQEEFDSITKAYYRDAEACVVAFSTIDRASFDAVESWIKKVEDEVGSIPMVLIQNKIDLVEQAVMTKDEAEGLAEKVKLRFYRTSVQENFNVDEVFDYLGHLFVENMRKSEQEQATSSEQNGQSSAPTSSSRFQNEDQDRIRIETPRRRTAGKKKGSGTCSLI